MSLPSSSFQSGPRVSDVIAWDQEQYSRDVGTVAAGSGGERALTIGMVLAKDGDGNFVQLAPAAADGTEVSVGIARNNVSAPDGAAAVNQLNVDARLASAIATGLVWPAGITAPQQATAIAELEALGIIVK